MPLTPKLGGYKPQPKKFNGDEQSLRDLLNVQNNDLKMPNLPAVPKHAPQFRPEPLVYGKKAAGLMENYYKLAPELRGRLKELMLGPNEPVQGVLSESGYRPNEWNQTNLLGVTDKDGKIGVSPSLDGSDLEADYAARSANSKVYQPDSTTNQVLGHELTHLAGYGEGFTNYAENKVRKLSGLNELKKGVNGHSIPMPQEVENGIRNRKWRGEF